MSLSEFQRALSDLVASPERCRELIASPGSVLSRYELSALERHRLGAIVRQRGMRLNCTLYRLNRVTPIYSQFPRTCSALGEALRPELELFWRTHEDSDLQFVSESLRFAENLRTRLDAGLVDSPFVADVLRFELALHQLKHGDARGSAEGPRHLGSSLRLVRVEHEPRRVCAPPEEIAASPPAPASGEQWILLVAEGEHIHVRRLALELGRLLAEVEQGRVELPPEALAELRMQRPGRYSDRPTSTSPTR